LTKSRWHQFCDSYFQNYFLLLYFLSLFHSFLILFYFN
jgi:hypothetical protein